jgi:Protein of unknown function DUF262
MTNINSGTNISEPTLSTDQGIEGGDQNEGGGIASSPLDHLAIRDERRTAIDVVRRIGQGRFRMDPDFQRDFVWDKRKQSRLIESILLRIPLPVFYVAEDDNGLLVVVDGRQRLTTLQRFIDNEFKLEQLGPGDFDTKNFKSLPQPLQNRIEDCQLHFYIIEKTVPESARLDIFERVNGGEVLTRQQMRNAIYNGIATEFLKNQSQTDLFKKATGGTLNTGKMQDRELVNRFCAFFLLDISDYKGDMDKWLAEGLRQLKIMSDVQREHLQLKFQQGLKNNFLLFGEHAFRKHSPGAARRHPINASLFDVMMIELSKYDVELVQKKQEDLKFCFYELLQRKSDFWNAITYSPNSSEQVNIRFKAANKAFSEALNAD